jgi:hypothetical protein
MKAKRAGGGHEIRSIAVATMKVISTQTTTTGAAATRPRTSYDPML